MVNKLFNKGLLKHSGFQWTESQTFLLLLVLLESRRHFQIIFQQVTFSIYFLLMNFLTLLLSNEICMQLNTKGTIRIYHHIAVPMSGEMKEFVALSLLFARKPEIAHHWSTNPHLKGSIFNSVMPRNTFQSILQFLHFADNRQFDPDQIGFTKLGQLLST